MGYTFLLLVKHSDFSLAERTSERLLSFFDIEKIVIISNIDRIQSCKRDPRITLLHEDKLFPGLSYTSVKRLMSSTDYLDPRLTGHCFQQLLKMAFSIFCDSEGYLVWDADTIPLREIAFYNEKKDITTFHMKGEYVEDYFINLRRLLNIEKQIDKSFISEHMYFKTSVMREIIEMISNNNEIKGDSWWEKVVYAMPCGNGMSEYEIYGNFMAKMYPEKCRFVDANSLRYGRSVLGDDPSKELLDWLSHEYDCVSFESWDLETFLTYLSEKQFVRRINPRFYCSLVSTANRGINKIRRFVGKKRGI